MKTQVQPYVYVGCLGPLLVAIAAAAVVVVVVVNRPGQQQPRSVILEVRNGPTVISTQVIPLDR